MISAVMAAIGVVMVALAIVALRFRAEAGAVALLVALITVGLAYDNLAVAVGQLIGYGDLLRAVNVPRFWLHALLTPLLIVVGAILVGRLGIGWLRTRIAAVVVSGLVAALIVVGVIEEIVHLELVPEDAGDALRYVNDAVSGPPIPAIVTILVLIGLGGLAWRTAGLPWLFAGSVAMLLAAGLGAEILWLANVGELVLQAAVVATLATTATTVGAVMPTTSPTGGHL
jgi:hypothetical protein